MRLLPLPSLGCPPQSFGAPSKQPLCHPQWRLGAFPMACHARDDYGHHNARRSHLSAHGLHRQASCSGVKAGRRHWEVVPAPGEAPDGRRQARKGPCWDTTSPHAPGSRACAPRLPAGTHMSRPRLSLPLCRPASLSALPPTPDAVQGPSRQARKMLSAPTL